MAATESSALAPSAAAASTGSNPVAAAASTGGGDTAGSGTGITSKLSYYFDVGFKLYKLVFVAGAIVWVALTASPFFTYYPSLSERCESAVQPFVTPQTFGNNSTRTPQVRCDRSLCPSNTVDPPDPTVSCTQPRFGQGTVTCCDNGWSCSSSTSGYGDSYDTSLGALQIFFFRQQLAIYSPCTGAWNPVGPTITQLQDAANVCGPKRFFDLQCQNGTSSLDPTTGDTIDQCTSFGSACPDTCNAIGGFYCVPNAMSTFGFAIAIAALCGESFRQLMGAMAWCGFGRDSFQGEARIPDIAFENVFFALHMLLRPGYGYAYLRDPKGGLATFSLMHPQHTAKVTRRELPYCMELFVLLTANATFACLSLVLAIFQDASGFSVFKCVIGFSIAILKILIMCGRQAREDVNAYHSMKDGTRQVTGGDDANAHPSGNMAVVLIVPNNGGNNI